MTDSTALTVIERAQVALQPAANDKQLAELAAASKSILTITNSDGYQQCHATRMALKNQRVAIEKIAKSAREDATTFSKAVIAEEKRLIGIIAPEEQRLETLQGAWDAARAAEKKAREEAERARIGEIQRRLAKLQALPEIYTAVLAPDRLAEVVTQLEAGLTYDYQEFAAEAETARQAALVALRQAHVEALERIEREESARVAEAARLAQEAAERAEAEERRRQENALREADRLARQAAEDAERAERDRIAAEAQAAEEARLAEVRRRLDAEQAEQRRVTEIRQWIVALNGPAHLTATDSPMLIEQAVNTLLGAVVDERYGEFHTEAGEAREAGIQRLRSLLQAAQAHKAEQERIAAERAELERQQRDQAERQAEIERREQEAREAEERRRAEEQARIVAEQAAAREAEELRAAQAEAARARQEWRAKALASPPDAGQLVAIIAEEYDVDTDIAAQWLANVRHEDWVALAVGEQEAA